VAKLPNPTGEELIAALQKIGFSVVRQKGSHVRMKHEDNRVVSIPVHARKTIGKGLHLKILRDADLTKEDLINLLGQLGYRKEFFECDRPSRSRLGRALSSTCLSIIGRSETQQHLCDRYLVFRRSPLRR
jgi:predicted RNA binding protein YcfA (HicA-like mRNA interferase family)